MLKTFFSGKKLWRVLGRNHQNKKRIEESMNISLEISGSEITIKSRKKDSVAEYITSEILEALSLGFNFEAAIQLKNPDYVLKEINLKNYVKQSRLETIKGRIIGTQGKAKKVIKNITDVDLALTDNVVAIIGTAEKIEVVSKAVESLIQGSPHSAVYKYLEKSRAKLIEIENEDVEDFIKK